MLDIDEEFFKVFKLCSSFFLKILKERLNTMIVLVYRDKILPELYSAIDNPIDEYTFLSSLEH